MKRAPAEPCPFCQLDDADLVYAADLVVCLRDRYPVSPGHTLVITRRHVETYFDASPWEQQAIWQAVAEVKRELDATLSPAGYNVGFNAGHAAGQTISHLHVHVIPRYDGDVPNPRGGVRGVIPDEQDYGDDRKQPGNGPADGSASAARRAEPDGADPFAALPRFVPGEEQRFVDTIREAIALADAIDILVAFVQQSGLELLRGDLEDALSRPRPARLRILTGDSLGITHADALRRLLAMADEHPSCEVRFYQSHGDATFHPKAYLFTRGPHGIGYIGSSNLSRSALTDSIEWNLRSVSADEALFRELRARFERLFESPRAVPLTRAVIERYERIAPVPRRPEPRPALPQPHVVQQAALAALRQARDEGAKRGLVVMATGLGKTYLSAMDFAQLGGARALFIAHREEILEQAREAWERFFPDKLVGLYKGATKEPDADLVFASVQTLSRLDNLAGFGPRDFDYLVIDEFHHAAAATYRRLLGHFRPRFLLGLTATPDRMDGASLLALCDDRLVYRAGLLEGIQRALLVPFHYYGVRDEVDYAPIPWRSGRFDIERLTEAVATTGRAEQALREYRAHAPERAPRRTLAFCCSIAHADFTAEFLRERGIEAVAVHSGESSAPRSLSLRRFERGEVEVVCCVDVFNEGVDVPAIDTVLMLRPTESPVIYLQQIGRGLRRHEQSGKTHLTIVDFIGNHRSFMAKPQALVALLAANGQELPAPVALRKLREGDLELPPGCHVDIETAAIDMLERLARTNRVDQLLYAYLSLRDSHGRRPTAAELHAERVSLRALRSSYGSWFDFVEAQGDLSEAEARVLEQHRSWLEDVETTSMQRSYKMVVLRSLIDRGSLFSSDRVDELAADGWEQLRTDLLLRTELKEYLEKADGRSRFDAMWPQMPLQVWADGKSTSRPWFALEDETFRSLLDVDEADRDAFEAMTLELVELRLARHKEKLRRKALEQVGRPILMKVSHTGGNPILRFDRKARPDIPRGEVPVEVDGRSYHFRFVKIAVNVAMDEPGGPNVLPRLMRAWFGPSAGLPGTTFHVRLEQRGDAWTLQPDQPAPVASRVIAAPVLPFWEDLRIACDAALGRVTPGPHSRADLAVAWDDELDPARHFVVRAVGDSMDGGVSPIADGDLVLCELVDPTSTDDIEGHPYLVAGIEGGDQVLAAIKVPIRTPDGWRLRSWNPAHPDTPVPDGVRLRPVARVLGPVTEAPALELWGRYDRDAICAQFGAKNDPSWKVGHRDLTVRGQDHTVLMVTLRKGKDLPLEHQYHDRFVSPEEFQWESQAKTTPESLKGRRIIEQEADDRFVHLFVRYRSRTDFVYCGTVRYLRHEGSQPMRVWFALDRRLPDELWRLWSGV